MALKEADLIDYARSRTENLAGVYRRAKTYVEAYETHAAEVAAASVQTKTGLALEQARVALLSVGNYERNNIEIALRAAKGKR